jgi:hypothetical protein
MREINKFHIYQGAHDAVAVLHNHAPLTTLSLSGGTAYEDYSDAADRHSQRRSGSGHVETEGIRGLLTLTVPSGLSNSTLSPTGTQASPVSFLGERGIHEHSNKQGSKQGKERLKKKA